MAKAELYAVDTSEVLVMEENDDKPKTNEMEIMECPVCLQLCVHPSKLPCGHIFCFLCVKGLKNRRCAMCRAEFSSEFLEHPQLLNSSMPSTSNLDQNEYQWFYKGHNGWWQYDERTCQEIEDAYKKAQKQCTILVAGNLYIVDFDQMLQKRQTDPSRKRLVKRDLATIPKKGVAGLRLWNNDGTEIESGNSSNSNNSSNLSRNNHVAATEAAIRIASDIIDSTLAHADDRNETDNVNSVTLVNMTTNDRSNTIQVSSSSDSSASRDMLDEIEETFNITNPSSINTSFRPTSQINDFFSSTLDEFRNFTLNNIVDDSSDENEDRDTAHSNFAENSITSRK